MGYIVTENATWKLSAGKGSISVTGTDPYVTINSNKVYAGSIKAEITGYAGGVIVSGGKGSGTANGNSSNVSTILGNVVLDNIKISVQITGPDANGVSQSITDTVEVINAGQSKVQAK